MYTAGTPGRSFLFYQVDTCNKKEGATTNVNKVHKRTFLWIMPTASRTSDLALGLTEQGRHVQHFPAALPRKKQDNKCISS
jgi:hypothetical protein